MADPSKISIREILGSLSVGQAWSATAALIAVATGIFAVGAFTERSKMDKELSDERSRAKAAIQENNERKMELNLLKRLYYYQQDSGTANKEALVDIVCSMWKVSEQNRHGATATTEGPRVSKVSRTRDQTINIVEFTHDAYKVPAEITTAVHERRGNCGALNFK